MIFNQGYSYRTKQLARERIEKLKQQNQQEIVLRKQKIKELSKQTNELRRKIKDKTQLLQEDEEERRATILENRKLKQRIATEKFQRLQDKRAKSRKGSAFKNTLKNGLYHVNGHVIEIKDGVRVSSTKKDDLSKTLEETPAYYNTETYAPGTYLSDHLNDLISTDYSQVKPVNKLNDAELSDLPPSSITNISKEEPLISDVLNDINYGAQLARQKINTAVVNENVDDSDSDHCSVDSLEDAMQEREQKMLKSSLKMPTDGLNESGTRKVTFSDSIEFNDGNVARLDVQPIERIPLYQRIENKNKEITNTVTSLNPKPLTTTNSKPVTYMEEVPAKPCEEILITNISEIRYPESVTAALEQLSQSKKVEKEVSKEKVDGHDKVSYNSNDEFDDSLKSNDEKIDDYHKECLRKNSKPVTEVNEIREVVQNVISGSFPTHTYTGGHQNEITKETYSTGYEVKMERRKGNSAMPVSTLSRIYTSPSPYKQNSNMINQDNTVLTPTSIHMTSTHGHNLVFHKPIAQHSILKNGNDNTHQTSISKHNYQNNNTTIPAKPESLEEAISSCSSVTHPTTIPLTTSYSSKPTLKKTENSQVSSAVLYVPQYPYFPSKEQRYAANGAYDGRLPLNYYESQYKDSHRNTSYNQNVNVSDSSRITLNRNGYHSAYISQGSPVSSSKITSVSNDINVDAVTRELSLSYINITACDISSRTDKHSKTDDIYKEVERTLADITFSKTQNKSMNEKPSYTNGTSQHNINTSSSSIKKTETPTCSEPNESKISNAIKNGTAIPVRVHTNNTSDSSPVRRGRVIVSADKKRRQFGNMLPRPPDKPKTAAKTEKNHVSLTTKKGVSKDEKSVITTNHKMVDNEQDESPFKYFSISNSVTSVNNRTTNDRVNSQRTPVKTNSDYYTDHNSSRNGINNTDNYTDLNNNITKYASPGLNALPKSYVRASPNVLPWNKSPPRHFSQIPLDKTPTDDEINKLWTNVRECIYTEQTEHAYSDSNYVIDNRYRKQYRRTLSGSSVDRRMDDRQAPRIYTNYTSGGMNRRYGSHDSLNRQIVTDSFSPAFNKPALLPHRATKIIRNSNSCSENKYTVFKGNDNLSNGHRYKYDSQTGKYGDVTSSMASFLVLEELCKKQSLTPRQAEAVFQASNAIQKKLDREKQGISMLSMEERCVMESLERLNEKLKERGFSNGSDPKTISSKPPLPEQRRRLNPAQ